MTIKFKSTDHTASTKPDRAGLKLSRALHDQLKSAAVASHMPMTKVIELAVAGRFPSGTHSAIASQAPRNPSVSQPVSGNALAMYQLAAALAAGISVEQPDDGLCYVSVAIGDFAFLLTPEHHDDGAVDIVFNTPLTVSSRLAI